MQNKTKTLCILISLLVLFTVASTEIKVVSAQETDVPFIEEINFTDGGASEIDSILLAQTINIHENDLLVLVLVSDNNEAGIFFNEVENFTKLGESGDQLCDSHIAVYYKIADGTEYEVNVTSATASNMLGWYIQIHGVDPDDIIEAHNFGVSTAIGVNPHSIPSITTNHANCLILSGISLDGGECYPTSVLDPFVELSDRVNTGAPLDDYACGAIGYRELECAGASENCLVYTETTDGASYFQLALNGNIETTETTASTGVFYDLFLSTEIWGYLGPVGLVIIGYLLVQKEKGLGIIMIIIDSLITYHYLTLVETTPDYWWHAIILILGIILCVGQMSKR